MASLTEAELDEFERCSRCRISDLLAWVTGECESAAANYDTALFRRLRDFHRKREDVSEADGEISRRTAEARAAARRWRSVADGAEGLVLADLARAIAARARCAGDLSLAVHLPRRPAPGGAGARAGLLRARHRDHGIPGLGLPALRPRLAECRRRRAAHDRAVAACAREGPRPAVDPADHRQRRAAARAGARLRGDAVRLSVAPGNVIDMDGIVALARAQRLRARLDRARARRICGARRHPRPLSRRAWTSRCGSISSATRWNRSAPSTRRPSARQSSCARSTSCR